MVVFLLYNIRNHVILPLSINIFDLTSGLWQTFINTSNFVRGWIHPVTFTSVNAISYFIINIITLIYLTHLLMKNLFYSLLGKSRHHI
jgi:hypothetical protein